MDPNVTSPERPPSLLKMLDSVLQIGLVALLIFACSRIILPFTGILLWSVILAVMLYPLHQRLVVRVGNRWSATLIGLVSVALMLVPLVMVVTSLGVVNSRVRFGRARRQPDRSAAAATAGRRAPDRTEADRDMGARSDKHAGGVGEIRSGAKWCLQHRWRRSRAVWQPVNCRSYFRLRSLLCSSRIAKAPPNLPAAFWNVSLAARHKARGWLR